MFQAAFVLVLPELGGFNLFSFTFPANLLKLCGMNCSRDVGPSVTLPTHTASSLLERAESERYKVPTQALAPVTRTSF